MIEKKIMNQFWKPNKDFNSLIYFQRLYSQTNILLQLLSTINNQTEKQDSKSLLMTALFNKINFHIEDERGEKTTKLHLQWINITGATF